MPLIDLHSQPCSPFVLPNDDPKAAHIGLALHRLLFACERGDAEGIKAQGQALWQLGGHALMQLACYFISSMEKAGYFGDPDDPDTFSARTVEFLWDGIGVWMS